MNIGEEIVSAYLEYIKGCEFVQRNLYTPDAQGEIDVVGIDIDNKTIYVCEVAIHLATGLQYTKSKGVNNVSKVNNVNKLYEKFCKDIDYANKYFPKYKKIFMLWSPIVKNQKATAKHNQIRDVQEVIGKIRKQYKVEIDDIINERFLNCINELRDHAAIETKEIKSPVLRLFQIEEKIRKHLGK